MSNTSHQHSAFDPSVEPREVKGHLVVNLDELFTLVDWFRECPPLDGGDVELTLRAAPPVEEERAKVVGHRDSDGPRPKGGDASRLPKDAEGKRVRWLKGDPIVEGRLSGDWDLVCEFGNGRELRVRPSYSPAWVSKGEDPMEVERKHTRSSIVEEHGNEGGAMFDRLIESGRRSHQAQNIINTLLRRTHVAATD